MSPPFARAQDVARPAETAPPLALTPATPPGSWVARGTAEVQVLDKINARHAVLNIRVGESAQSGTLRIEVKGCVVRPPDQQQDAAAFLAITDANGDGVPFSGWMVANQPALSMLQHPVYDVRVTGCRQ